MKAAAPLTLAWLFWACVVARQQDKMHSGLTFSLKFYFEKEKEVMYDIYTFKNILFVKDVASEIGDSFYNV